MISGTTLEMFWCKYGFEPLTYLAAFAGVFFVVGISKVKTFAIIRYIGENSLVYYAWHQTIFMPIVSTLFGKMKYFIHGGSSPIECIAYYLVSLIVIVLLLTICNEIIMKTKLRKLIGR